MMHPLRPLSSPSLFLAPLLAFALMLLPAGAGAQSAAAAQPAAKSAAATPVLAGPLNVATANPDDVWYLDLSSGGRVAIVLRPELAPHAVERIQTLTRQGFYNGQIFHRVVEGFMAQSGDPTGTGTGGSTLPDLKAEFNDAPHMRGTVAMARAQADDSANSQFYIMLQPLLRLDRHYTVIGRVVSGMQYVDAIHRGEPPADPTKILQASLESEHKAPPDFAALQQQNPDPVAAAAASLLQGAPNAAPGATSAASASAPAEGPVAPAASPAETPAGN